MILEKGDMWSVFEQSDLFCITTNSYIRRDGALVMGRGIARQAALRFPDLPYRAGEEILRRGLAGGAYYLITLPNTKIALFQVKRFWKSTANLDLIRGAAGRLYDLLTHRATLGLPELRIDLNFPGIGNGGMPRSDVLPIISTLPDCVHVWELGVGGLSRKDAVGIRNDG